MSELLPQHLADLRASGLSDDAIAAGRYYSITTAAEIETILGWHPGDIGPALVIPYITASGKRTFFARLKPNNPRIDKRGKLVKYESPKGEPNHVYLPPGIGPALADAAVPLVLTEGEKKAARAMQDGFACIGLVGVYGWQRKRKNQFAARELIDDLAAVKWAGRPVFICYDSDAATKPGVAAAENRLAEALEARGATVKVVRLPAGPHGEKMGLDDFLVSHGADAFRKLLSDAAQDDNADDDADKASMATRLVRLALASGAQLIHDADQTGFAVLPVSGHAETLPLRGTAFRRWLSRLLFEREGRVPGGQALADAIGVLEGRAHFDGPEMPVQLRTAEAGGKLYLDLADEHWRAVEIDADGWRVVSNPPVRFRRTKGVLPLPVPEPSGSLDILREYVNVADDGDWRLMVAWLIAAMRPRGPYCLIALYGQQGSAKSTVGRILRSLIDPSTAPLRSAPREPRDLMIAANNGWLLAYDNLSYIPGWLSDGLCCLSTGGGFSARQLYSDGEEVIFAACRPVLLTSIEDVATSSDLLDRALLLSLPPIPEEQRQIERELWARFERDRPRILGALLTALAATLRALPSIKPVKLPRMADFAEMGMATEMALGWPAGSFLEAVAENRADAHLTALEASPLVPFIRALMATRAEWTGTATALLAELSALAGEKEVRKKEWPKNPRVLAGRLQRLAPNLRASGIDVEFFREGKACTRMIRLIAHAIEGKGNVASVASAAPETVKNPHENRGLAADAKNKSCVCLASAETVLRLPDDVTAPSETPDGEDGRRKTIQADAQQTQKIKVASASKPLENKGETPILPPADAADAKSRTPQKRYVEDF